MPRRSFTGSTWSTTASVDGGPNYVLDILDAAIDLEKNRVEHRHLNVSVARDAEHQKASFTRASKYNH